MKNNQMSLFQKVYIITILTKNSVTGYVSNSYVSNQLHIKASTQVTILKGRCLTQVTITYLKCDSICKTINFLLY